MASLHVQKPNLAGQLAGLHMKNRIQLARSRSATLRRESIEIWLDLDKIRQDPASSPRRCCSIDFDQNRHYPTDLKPNQTVFSAVGGGLDFLSLEVVESVLSWAQTRTKPTSG